MTWKQADGVREQAIKDEKKWQKSFFTGSKERLEAYLAGYSEGMGKMMATLVEIGAIDKPEKTGKTTYGS